ncbi:MAG: cytochrome c [Oceanicaulis sp.]|nr:cytochrome c [Oceanicaulis sp.]
MSVMMRALLVAGISLSGAGIATAVYANDIRDSIEDRQSLMKLVGAHNRGLKAAVDEGNAERVQSLAGELQGVAAMVPEMFEPEAHTDNADGIKTGSLPAIYDRWDEFVQLAKNLEDAAGALSDTAASGDAAAMTDAFQELGKTCGACHSQFRLRTS